MLCRKNGYPEPDKDMQFEARITQRKKRSCPTPSSYDDKELEIVIDHLSTAFAWSIPRSIYECYNQVIYRSTIQMLVGLSLIIYFVPHKFSFFCTSSYTGLMMRCRTKRISELVLTGVCKDTVGANDSTILTHLMDSDHYTEPKIEFKPVKETTRWLLVASETMSFG